jgi:phosphatidylserine decarboxylase
VFAPGAGRPLAATLAVLLGLAAALILVAPAWSWLGAIGLALASGLWIFAAQFYRDPERPIGPDIVSPADGRIQLLRREGAFLRIAVFMNVHNVHVNRFPMDARVEAVGDAGHGFAPAYRDRAEDNVQRAYTLSTAIGPVTLVQITGAVARRLVSFVGPGESRAKGERLGMIVLGSRVDLILPADRVEPLVGVGARVRAGASAIARIRS